MDANHLLAGVECLFGAWLADRQMSSLLASTGKPVEKLLWICGQCAAYWIIVVLRSFNMLSLLTRLQPNGLISWHRLGLLYRRCPPRFPASRHLQPHSQPVVGSRAKPASRSRQQWHGTRRRLLPRCLHRQCQAPFQWDRRAGSHRCQAQGAACSARPLPGDRHKIGGAAASWPSSRLFSG